jgi:hypothetical protein
LLWLILKAGGLSILGEVFLSTITRCRYRIVDQLYKKLPITAELSLQLSGVSLITDFPKTEYYKKIAREKFLTKIETKRGQ